MKKRNMFTKLLAIGCSVSLLLGNSTVFAESEEAQTTESIQTEALSSEADIDLLGYGLQDIMTIPTGAIQISEHKTIKGSLDSPLSVQWYKVYFERSGIKELELTGISGSQDVGISLYQCTDNDTIERIAGSSSTTYHELKAYVKTQCMYYVAVEGMGGFDAGSGINYVLDMYNAAFTDEYEPNDDLDHATIVNINESSVTKQYKGTIHATGEQLDSDFFKVIPTHEGTVHISLTPYDTTPVNFLLSACVPEIDGEDEYKTWKAGNEQSYYLNEEEMCYIEIYTPRGHYDEDIEYTLTITYEDDMNRWFWDAEEELPVDLNNLSDPMALPTGLLTKDKPYMLYKYIADHNGNIQAELDTPNNTDYIFRIYDATNKKEIKVDNNAVAFDVTEGHQYALMVQALGGLYSKDTYRLVLGWDVYDAYEPNNSIAAATDISANVNASSASYSVEATAHMNDKDYYKIVPAQNTAFEVKIENTLSGAYSFMSIRGSGDNTIKEGTNVQFDGTAGTAYYILVTPGSVRTSPYKLTITKSTVTPPTTSPTPTPVPTATPVPVPTIAPDPEIDDIKIISNTFEDSNMSAWQETYATEGRGTKTLQTEADNHYMELKATGSSYYNFNGLHQDVSGNLNLKFDVKFPSGNMELQMRDVTDDHSSTGYTVGARLRKNAYYIEYFSDGTATKLLTPSGSWLQLNDVSKWYTVEMQVNTETKKQSIYLTERDSGKLIGKAENVNLSGNVEKLNWAAFSSTNTVGIDNVSLTRKGRTGVKLSDWNGKYLLRWNIPFDGDKYEITVNDKAMETANTSYVLYPNGTEMPKTYNIKVRAKNTEKNTFSEWIQSDISMRLYGDVDGNGVINVTDASCVMGYIAHIETLTGEQKLAADVNGDGQVTEEDSQVIQQLCVELIKEFPAGKTAVYYTSPSEAAAKLYGDVDGDGEVSISDSSEIAKYLSGQITLTEEQKILADVNGDGQITLDDANMIAEYTVKLITEFPVGTVALFI